MKRKGEKQLLQISKDFQLIEKLLSLKLTRQDFELYEERKKQSVHRLGRHPERSRRLREGSRSRDWILLPFGPQDDIQRGPQSDGPSFLPEAIRDAEKFYAISRARDEKLLENTLDLIKGDGKVSAVALVSGGFHSDGLTELMHEREIPHLVVSPKMSRFENEALYEKAMMGENVSIDHLLAKGNALVKWYLNERPPTEQRNLYLSGIFGGGVPWLERNGWTKNQIRGELTRIFNRNADLFGGIQLADGDSYKLVFPKPEARSGRRDEKPAQKSKPRSEKREGKPRGSFFPSLPASPAVLPALPRRSEARMDEPFPTKDEIRFQVQPENLHLFRANFDSFSEAEILHLVSLIEKLLDADEIPLASLDQVIKILEGADIIESFPDNTTSDVWGHFFRLVQRLHQKMEEGERALTAFSCLF